MIARIGGLLVALLVSLPVHAELLIVNGNRVDRYDPITGKFRGSVLQIANTLKQYTAITTGPDGLVYLADFVFDNATADGIRRIDPKTFELIDIDARFVNAGEHTAVKSPVFGPDGNLYLTGPNKHFVLRADGMTGQILPLGISINAPQALAVGPDGDLYVTTTEGGNGLISRFDIETGQFIEDFGFQTQVTHGDFVFLRNGVLRTRRGDYPVSGDMYGNFSATGTYAFRPDGSLFQLQGRKLRQLDPVTGDLLAEFSLRSGGDGIAFTSVPEPASMVLFAIAGCVLFMRRR